MAQCRLVQRSSLVQPRQIFPPLRAGQSHPESGPTPVDAVTLYCTSSSTHSAWRFVLLFLAGRRNRNWECRVYRPTSFNRRQLHIVSNQHHRRDCHCKWGSAPGQCEGCPPFTPITPFTSDLGDDWTSVAVNSLHVPGALRRAVIPVPVIRDEPAMERDESGRLDPGPRHLPFPSHPSLVPCSKTERDTVHAILCVI